MIDKHQAMQKPLHGWLDASQTLCFLTDFEAQCEVIVQHCANNSEYNTRCLHQSCVVVSQQCHRIVLSQISGTIFHCYLGNAVLG